jgi:hypothetical protein
MAMQRAAVTTNAFTDPDLPLEFVGSSSGGNVSSLSGGFKKVSLIRADATARGGASRYD